jgi:hypothetical protein
MEDGFVLPFEVSLEGKKMIEVLKTVRGWWRNLNLFFFQISLSDQKKKSLYHWTATLDFNLLSFHDFLDFSLSSKVFLVYTPCVLEMCLCAFNDISFAY